MYSEVLTRHPEDAKIRRPRQVGLVLQDLKAVQVFLDEVILERFQKLVSIGLAIKLQKKKNNNSETHVEYRRYGPQL